MANISSDTVSPRHCSCEMNIPSKLPLPLHSHPVSCENPYQPASRLAVRIVIRYLSGYHGVPCVIALYICLLQAYELTAPDDKIRDIYLFNYHNFLGKI